MRTTLVKKQENNLLVVDEVKLRRKKNMNNKIFSNFWQPESCKHLFFNVDVCEEVTKRIKNDENFARCKEEYPRACIGTKANISVSVKSGLPYILRSATGPFKAEFEIFDSELIVPLFTKEEMNMLAKMAEDVRKNNNLD